jgi:hypothetical protein
MGGGPAGLDGEYVTLGGRGIDGGSNFGSQRKLSGKESGINTRAYLLRILAGDLEATGDVVRVSLRGGSDGGDGGGILRESLNRT